MQRLEQKVAIVTGGASGLGLAVARQMVAEGASVVVADIDAGRARAAAEELGPRAAALEVDVGVERDVARMVRFAVERFGRLDVLHNNAAALGAEVFGRDGGITAMDAGVWDATFAVNVRGAMLGCKHAIPAMRDGGGGAIVNTSSVSALTGEAEHVAYASSKAALLALTRHVASMHGADRIRCNAVAPGLMLTPLALERLSARQLEEYRCERLLPDAPQPEDVAKLVVFLASSDAACITGQTYVADAGTLAHRPRHSLRAWEAAVRAGRLAGQPDG
jgi:NAD(P)-dependent dehydrogenase (short-subunit alcohol dehydrogenase family)